VISSNYNPAMQSPIGVPIAVHLGVWRPKLAALLNRSGVGRLSIDHSARPPGGASWWTEEIASSELLPLSDALICPSEPIALRRFIDRDDQGPLFSELREWREPPIDKTAISIHAYSPVDSVGSEVPGAQRISIRASSEWEQQGSLQLHATGADAFQDSRFLNACELMGLGDGDVEGAASGQKRTALVDAKFGSALVTRRNETVSAQIGNVVQNRLRQLPATLAEMLEEGRVPWPLLELSMHRVRSVRDYIASDELFDRLACSALRQTTVATVEFEDDFSGDPPWVVPQAAWRHGISPSGYLSQTHLLKYRASGEQPRAVLLIDTEKHESVLECVRRVSPICEPIVMARPCSESA
jgi:hypothetical protein